MKAEKRDIPEFANEEEERIFWQTHDSTDYIDWSAARQVFLRSISLRLPEPLLARLRMMANERDIPYQSLIKMILVEHVEAHSPG